MSKTMIKIFLHFLFFAAVFIAYVRFVEYKTLFIPTKLMQYSPKDAGLEYEDIFFTTKDKVQLNGWLVKAENARATLIFFHGNAGNIGNRINKLFILNRMGVNVFIVDYRGFGNSEGRPSEKGMYLDAQAAYDYLLTRDDIDHDNIIAYGVSLGGVAAVDLATKRKLAALIVDSSFTSAKDMAVKVMPYVPSFILGVKLDSESKIKNIHVKKFIIHSFEDDVVPFHLGRKLYNAAPGPKEFWEIKGRHNDDRAYNQKYIEGMKKFLTENDFI